jgi:hypothetical protein
MEDNSGRSLSLVIGQALSGKVFFILVSALFCDRNMSRFLIRSTHLKGRNNIPVLAMRNVDDHN